ncbi:MAG: hypothetical protein GX345_00885 [Clostridiales bacterium]|nr:hypothetical protein [Clostridiales bacterium]
MNDKQLSLLGLCRRANLLSMGHDACMGAIAKGKASLCLLSEDASDRLQKKFAREIEFHESKIPLIHTPFTFEDIKRATGRPAGVLTINDKGFALSFLKLEENKTGGNSKIC